MEGANASVPSVGSLYRYLRLLCTQTWQSGPWGKGLCIALGAAAGLLTAAVVLIGIPPLFMWELGILAGSALLGCGLGVTAWCFFPRDRIGYVAQLAVAFARENAKNKKIIHRCEHFSQLWGICCLRGYVAVRCHYHRRLFPGHC